MMRSRSMMNANPQTINPSVSQQKPLKSNSAHNFCYDTEFNEYESTEDKTDSDFLIKPKKSTKRKRDKAKISNSILPDLSPYFFKGLHIFVKLSQIYQDENDEHVIKLALEQAGSIIVEDPKISDVIVTDEFYIKSPEYPSYKKSRLVLINQISWVKNFTSGPILKDLSSSSSFKILNRSGISSPMVNNDTNGSHISPIPPKKKNVSGLKITSPIRHVILPSNSTSPSAATMNANLLFSNIMNNRNNVATIPNQIYSQKMNSKLLNDPYGKIQRLSMVSNYQNFPMITVSDIRHLYAPITKVFNSADQVPRIYIETAPRFYFMTPFQPIPPNAQQIARSCMLDRMSKAQNKINTPPPNIKATNDISAVIGKTNFYCYICRVNFENPQEHHDSSYHMRNTTPLWEEFDNMASSFNEIFKEKNRETK